MADRTKRPLPARPVVSGPEDAPDFVIYGAPTGFVAVTNPVRQSILAAVEVRELTLTDLVELTGKSKSTLSGVHLKDLLEKGLVEERPHEKDARVKLYRLTAKRIGESSIPVGELKAAVQSFVTGSQGALALPFAFFVRACDAMPGLARDEARWLGLYGERLGALSAGRFRSDTLADVLEEIRSVWDREGLGEGSRVRGGGSAIELGGVKGEPPAANRCALVAGFLQGVLTTRLGCAALVTEKQCVRDGKARCAFEIRWPAGAP